MYIQFWPSLIFKIYINVSVTTFCDYCMARAPSYGRVAADSRLCSLNLEAAQSASRSTASTASM